MCWDMNALVIAALVAANSAHYCGVDVPWDLLIGSGDEAAVIEFGAQFVCGNADNVLICENGAEIHFEATDEAVTVDFINQPVDPPIILPRCDFVPA